MKKVNVEDFNTVLVEGGPGSGRRPGGATARTYLVHKVRRLRAAGEKDIAKGALKIGKAKLIAPKGNRNWRAAAYKAVGMVSYRQGGRVHWENFQEGAKKPRPRNSETVMKNFGLHRKPDKPFIKNWTDRADKKVKLAGRKKCEK
jgi:hypothetical protein